MSGHNKWSSIKHKKALVDAKRGKTFTKIIREITVAARDGGGDLETNSTLRNCVIKARGANMPQDNIQRAIKKGTGELEGVHFEEQQYEGYAPGGVALMIRALTDNKNRTSSEIKAILSKRGGNLAAQGAVSYMFHRKGFFAIPTAAIEEEELFLLVSEAGAEDLSQEGDSFEIVTDPGNFDALKKVLDDHGIEQSRCEITQIPESSTPVDDVGTARKILALIDALDDSDDVQSVYENSEIPENIMKELG